MPNSGFQRRHAAACAVVVTLAGAAAGSSELIPVYGAAIQGPSIALSYANGASPYSGIGRYDGLSACTAFFLDTAASFFDPDDPGADHDDARAYALTEARCAADLGSDQVLVDAPGHGRIVFNYFSDSATRQTVVRVAKTAYAAVDGQNLAVLELDAGYAELVTKLIRPWPVVSATRPAIGEPVAIVGAPMGGEETDGFLRLAFCRIDGIAQSIAEDRWRWLHVAYHRCRDVRAGSLGSPVLSVFSRAVVGLVSTTTAGGDSRAKCSLGRPCEPSDRGARSRPDTHYVSSLAGIHACFDARGRFDPDQQHCSLAAPTRDGAPSSARADVPRS
jgi:hypothetical protein